MTNDHTPMSEGQVEDLLRRTFSGREGDIDPDRAGHLMRATDTEADRTSRGARDRRRSRTVVLTSVAASLILIAVVLAVAWTRAPGTRDVPTEPVPAGTVSATTARRMSAAETTDMWNRLERGVRDAGTLGVVLRYEDAPTVPPVAGPAVPTGSTTSPASAASPGGGSQAEVPGLSTVLDLRDPGSARVRVSRIRARPGAVAGEPAVVVVGDRMWRRAVPEAGTTPRSAWTEVTAPPLRQLISMPFFWSVDPVDTAWDLGRGQIDGIPADHVVVSAGKDDQGAALRPTPRPTDGRALLDLWIATDSGRVLRARMEHDYDTLVARMTYGATITPITPPVTDQVSPTDGASSTP